MRDEIARVLKMVEDGKLTGEQASAMIDALARARRADAGKRKDRRHEHGPGARKHRGTRGRHRRHGDGRPLDWLGDFLGRSVEETVGEALRGAKAKGWSRMFDDASAWGEVGDDNDTTLARMDAPTGTDFKAEGNRIVVSEVRHIELNSAEFCDNTMHAASMHDIKVSNGALSRNTLRGSSVRRAAFAASDVTGNTVNGGSLSQLSFKSSNFTGNAVNAAQIRGLALTSASVRDTRIEASRLRDIVMNDGTVLDRVGIAGISAERWTLSKSSLNGVRFANSEASPRLGSPRRHRSEGPAAHRSADLTLQGVKLTDCDFTDCKFDATTFSDFEADGISFNKVDFTGMTIASAERFAALAEVQRDH